MEIALHPTPKPRYLSRHLWYLADAQLLIRRLQALAWPLGWHIALGGGVLNHGYSDKDLDVYALPIYNRPEAVDELTFYTRIATEFDNPDAGEPVCSLEDNPHECFKYSMRFHTGGKPVELFVVRRF